MDFVSNLQSFFTSLSQADLYVLAGVLASGLQYLINYLVPREKGLGEVGNWVVSFVLPLVSSGLLLLLSNHKIAGSVTYVAAQLTYFIVEFIRSKSGQTVVPKVEEEKVEDVPTVSDSQLTA